MLGISPNKIISQTFNAMPQLGYTTILGKQIITGIKPLLHNYITPTDDLLELIPFLLWENRASSPILLIQRAVLSSIKMFCSIKGFSIRSFLSVGKFKTYLFFKRNEAMESCILYQPERSKRLIIF